MMHGRAYAARLPPTAGSNLLIAFSKPTYPTCIRSSAGSGLPRYGRTQNQTRPWWRVTSSSHATAHRSLACGNDRTMPSSARSSSPASSFLSVRSGGAGARQSHEVRP
jgi:hypothetical protein